jgi:hypothetical protein
MKKGDPISFRIRADIKATLQELAAADRRSLSSYIELLLEEHIIAQRTEQRGSKKGR